MRWVRPKIYLIAKSTPDGGQIKQWLLGVGCDELTAQNYAEGEWKTDGERIIELAGRRCYLSFQVGLNPNVTRIRENLTEYIDNILSSGHGSVLEHVTYTFAIENVSRVFTGEMNRHRAGMAISEGSMRYIRYNDIPIVEVDSLIANDPDEAINQLIEQDRYDINVLMLKVEETYMKIADRWKDVLNGKDFTKKKHLTSRMRRIIPMGVATGGIWTGNVRALRHLLTMRCSVAAEEEILDVAVTILKIMMEAEPRLFGDFVMHDGFYGPKYKKV